MSADDGVVYTFGPDYDAKLSTANALEKVRQLIDAANSTSNVLTDRIHVQIAAAQLWVGIAQVHATAALTLATEANTAQPQAKKTCRCP